MDTHIQNVNRLQQRIILFGALCRIGVALTPLIGLVGFVALLIGICMSQNQPVHDFSFGKPAYHKAAKRPVPIAKHGHSH